MKKTTIYEIAKQSGVSVSTVSRVLNGSEHVSMRTLERVRAVIDENQYQPSAVARAMTINRTGTLGVVMPDIANPYFSSLFLEIERYALQNEYSIMLCNTLFGGSSHGVPSPFTEGQYFEQMLRQQVDGVIVIGGEIDKELISQTYIHALSHLANAMPVVVLGQPIDGCGAIFLNRNLGAGFSSLVRHLSALGNRRIGFVGGEQGVRQTTARFEVYRETLESLSLPHESALTAFSNYYSKDGYEAMMRILDSPAPKPDAVVAINDAVAIGAIRALVDYGLNCPQDVAVVSGDQFFESEFITPRLTSLNQRNDYLGRLTIMTMLGAIRGINETIEIEHSPKLIIRESCGSQIARSF